MGAASSLTWDRIDVDGRSVCYAEGGSGPLVLFLHGWALSARAYRRPLGRLIRRGCRVLAPALPGLGGSADLSPGARDLGGYGRWAIRFLDQLGVDEPVMVIGHSLGGGVAISVAHADPGRVRYLILLNAVGGGRGHGDVARDRPLSGRPLVSWAGRVVAEGAVSALNPRSLRALVPEVAGNLLRNPRGVVRAAELARDADLTAELADLRRQNLPVLALHTEGDDVIPRAAFDALCAAIGTDGHIVAGRQAWLLTQPDSLGSVSPEDRAELLAEASPLWLMGEEEPALVADLALCVAPLEEGEVRAVVQPLVGTRRQRLTVVTADRPGLLADTAAVLAGEGLSIATVSAVTWPRRGLALHSVTVDPEEGFAAERWGAVLERLRGERDVIAPAVRLSAALRITVHAAEGDRTLVTVSAPDQLGLLARVCRWLADHGVGIESLRATTEAGWAEDGFLVCGDVDVESLTEWLRAPGRQTLAGAS